MQQGNGAGSPSQMGMMHTDTGGNSRWKTWQSDNDIPSRKILIQHMYVPAYARSHRRTNPNASQAFRGSGCFFPSRFQRTRAIVLAGYRAVRTQY